MAHEAHEIDESGSVIRVFLTFQVVRLFRRLTKLIADAGCVTARPKYLPKPEFAC